MTFLQRPRGRRDELRGRVLTEAGETHHEVIEAGVRWVRLEEFRVKRRPVPVAFLNATDRLVSIDVLTLAQQAHPFFHGRKHEHVQRMRPFAQDELAAASEDHDVPFAPRSPG